jgi:hypothetical protein
VLVLSPRRVDDERLSRRLSRPPRVCLRTAAPILQRPPCLLSMVNTVARLSSNGSLLFEPEIVERIPKSN